jgi:O-antigen/teichoic acid export membrane protein
MRGRVTAVRAELRERNARGVPVMVALTLVASALNYLSSVVFSRVLDPVGFGELTSLLALSVILTIPTGAAQTVIAERVAVHSHAGDTNALRYLIRHAVGHVAAIAAVVALLYVLAIPLVIEALNLRVPGPAIALSAMILLGFLVPIAFAVLQGLDRFVTFGLMLVAVSLSRIVFGVSWAWAGGGAGGAIAGQALGMAVILLLSAWILRDKLLRRGTGAATSGLRRRPDVRTVSASGAFIAFAVISNLDVLLAKVFMSGEQVGIYAAVATVGKIVTFMPAAIAVAMVPDAARAQHSEGDSSRVLRLSALLVAGTAIAAAIPAAVAPGLLVSLMFGPGYEAAESGVLPIVCAGAGLAMLNLLVVYSVAIRDQRWVLLLAAGVVVQVVGVALFHGSPTEVATVQAVAALAVLALNEAFSHSLVWRRRVRS